MTYTPERFNELVKEFLEQEAATMGHKRTEYSSDEDRLQNFREVAGFEGRTMEEVCLTYLLKHIQSIALAVRTGKHPWHWHDGQGREGMKQRISDARIYLLLLAACIEERVAL